MTKLTWILLASAGCTLDGSAGHTGLQKSTQVALVPSAASRDVDVLFVVDDSPSMLAKQQALVAAFPEFADTLAGAASGMPNLHIGVASTDMGTTGSLEGQPAASIGTGPGACKGTGKDGVLATSPVVTGPFISDVENPSLGRTRNYTGTIGDAFTSLASLGAEGCGFEQPLRAAARALDNPMNAGFVRDSASLAIVTLTDEDDCSIAHNELMGSDTSTFGPLQSFRCTRFGVTCRIGGEDPAQMNQTGAKTECGANESVGYLTSIAELASDMMLHKADPRTLMFGAIVAPASNIDVEMRTPPGGGSAIPALAHACTFPSDLDEDVLDPAVRITETASLFPRSHISTMCGGDVRGALLDMAREIRGMIGDGCLTSPIAQPAVCEAFDTHVDGSETRLGACDASADLDCFRLVTDPTCGGQGLRVEVIRSYTPAPDTMVSLRCAL